MLTRRQEQVFAVYEDAERNGRPSPTFQELKDALGLASKSGPFSTVEALIRKGYLERTQASARAVRVNPKRSPGYRDLATAARQVLANPRSETALAGLRDALGPRE